MATEMVFLSVKEVAQRLNVIPHTVYVWIKQGKIKAKKFGRMVRISEESYQEYIKN